MFAVVLGIDWLYDFERLIDDLWQGDTDFEQSEVGIISHLIIDSFVLLLKGRF
jgi:hypothetical protein